MTKSYDRAALIEAYIQANQPHYLHDDFKTYAVERLTALQRAFGITLTPDGVTNPKNRVFWMLFHTTVESYLSIRTPRSGFVDDSLMQVRLEQLGDEAKAIIALETTIEQATSLNRRAHLHLLDELVVLLWGPLNQVFTSEELLQFGFDDTTEPQLHHYLDDL